MEFIQNVFYIIITAAVPILTTYVCKFLYTKWTEGKSHIKHEHVTDVLDQVVSMVLNCVQTTTQTFVDELKKKGEFTEDAAKEAFAMTKEAALSMLSEEASNIITEVYCNVDVYIDTLIESLVKQLKDEK